MCGKPNALPTLLRIPKGEPMKLNRRLPLLELALTVSAQEPSTPEKIFTLELPNTLPTRNRAAHTFGRMPKKALFITPLRRGHFQAIQKEISSCAAAPTSARSNKTR